jgi:hypothetical protein
VELVKIAPDAIRPMVRSDRRTLLGRRSVGVGVDTSTPLVRQALGWDLGVHAFRWDTDALHSGGSVKEQWHAVLLTEPRAGEQNDGLIIRAADEYEESKYHMASGRTSPPVSAGPGRLFLKAEGMQRGPSRHWVGADMETFALIVSRLAGLPSWSHGDCGCSQSARVDLWRDDLASARKWVDEDPRFASFLS